MKHIYIVLSLALLALASCQKMAIDGPLSSDNVVSDQKVLLRSMLATRDTKWTEDELSIPQVNDGWNLIATPGELAFLLEFGSIDGAKYRLVNDIDVSASAIADKFTCEIGPELFENIEFDGNGKTLSGMNLPLAAGLFSRMTGDSKIYNLNISDCSFGSADNLSNLLGTGALAGTVSGNLTATGIVVSECNVCAPCKVGGIAGAITDGNSSFKYCQVLNTNVKTLYFKGVSGWCGGFIGFVGRSEEKNTSLAVSLTAEGCTVSGGNIQTYMESSTRYCGKFIGSVVGYNSGETVSLDECTASPASFTVEGAKGGDFESIFPDNLIGGHKYMNGKIYLDGLLYVKPWDGKTTREPALSDGAYMVYTAEELAWFQGKTVTKNIKICDDINLGGHLFTPLYSASYIDGLKEDGTNCEIRNLKVVRENCGKEDGGAFIRQATGTTVHKNITFRGADIKATHDPNADHGNAYCATLCGNMTGTYTMENVHAYDGKLYGVNKMGGLLGRVYATATIKDCSVSGYCIQNYEVNDKPETFSGTAEKLGATVTATATFYPHGEIGGMIGFIHGNAEVSGCHVYKTQINAIGQADVKASLSGSTLAVLAINAIGGFTVPGRHISTLIGDIRTGNSSSSFKITISDCSADSETESMMSSWDKHDSSAAFIGQCYYIYSKDKSDGSVAVNGNGLSIKHCINL